MSFKFDDLFGPEASTNLATSEEKSASSSSSLMASAFASVSDMAFKIKNFTPPSSPAFLAEKNTEKTKNNSVLLKALSITKLKSDSTSSSASSSSLPQSVDSETKPSSLISSKINNLLLSPFESNSNQNKNNSKQKEKQNLFFKKLEAHSLSLSSKIGIYSDSKPNNVNMMSQNSFNKSINENSNSTPEMSHTGSAKRKAKPPGTIEYIVEQNDTIEKIALKWNTVPSEIQHLNRLVTRVIFPGQTIFVPDPNYVPPAPPSSPPETHKIQLPESIINELNTLELNQSLSSANNSINTSINISNNDTPNTKDLKQQPNNKQGFNIFKWKSTPAPKPGHVELQKQKSITLSLSEQVSISSNNNSFSKSMDEKKNQLISRHTLTEEEAKKLDEECMQRFLKVNCKIVTRSKGCFDGVLIITPSAVMFDPIDSNSKYVKNSRKNSLTYVSSIYDEASAIIPIEVISNVIMYEDLALKDVQEYFDYQYHIDEIELDNKSDVDQKERSNSVTFNLLHENENQNSGEINQNKDKSLTSENEENTKSRANSANDDKNSTTSSNNSSLISCYLCIKVNKNKDFITCPLDRKMKNRLSSEFWFQINDNSYQITDKICAFFLEWKSDPTFSLTDQTMPKGQFQLVKQDDRLADMILENVKNGSSNQLNRGFSSTNRLIHKTISSFVKDWEIVNLKELELKVKLETEIEKEYKNLPNLIEPSHILKEEHLRKLNVNLIPRAVGYNWILSFSTELHGFSLNTMYRQLAEIESPCLVVVQDSNLNIFGAMSPCKLYQSEHYYGTGESFLYTFYPSFKVFKWTGENNFFIRGNGEGLGFGCAEGYHGLWFDGDLLNGHTQRSKTYDNDMLTSTEYFTINALEVWTFFD